MPWLQRSAALATENFASARALGSSNRRSGSARRVRIRVQVASVSTVGTRACRGHGERRGGTASEEAGARARARARARDDDARARPPGRPHGAGVLQRHRWAARRAASRARAAHEPEGRRRRRRTRGGGARFRRSRAASCSPGVARGARVRDQRQRQRGVRSRVGRARAQGALDRAPGREGARRRGTPRPHRVSPCGRTTLALLQYGPCATCPWQREERPSLSGSCSAS